MKKIVYYGVIGCLLMFVLSGCGATPLTQNQVSLQTASNNAKTECYKGLATRDSTLISMLQHVPKDQISLVLVLTQMQESNKALMAMATGTNYDPCGSDTSAFDVQIAEIRSKNAAVSNISGKVLDLGKWVVGGVTLSSVVDNIGAKVGGDYIDNKIEGTGNSLIQDSYKSGSDNKTEGNKNQLISGDVVGQPHVNNEPITITDDSNLKSDSPINIERINNPAPEEPEEGTEEEDPEEETEE